MSSRDRAAEAAIDDIERPERPGGESLPAELRAELRRLLTAMLVADVRAFPTMPAEVGAATTSDADKNQRNRTLG